MDSNKQERAEALVRELLSLIGEDPDRPGLVETPKRVAASWREIYAGYDDEPYGHGKTFPEPEIHDDLVVLRDIRFFSSCEHHMLPFYGRVHIAYKPATDRVLGVSKLVRIMEVFSRRLQVQERMGRQIATAIQEAITPAGVGVVVEGSHMCMVMRGVQKPDSMMLTSCMLGDFRIPHLKDEVLRFMGFR